MNQRSLIVAVALLALACGSPTGSAQDAGTTTTTDAGTGAAPTLQGPLAFTAKNIFVSTQTAGSGGVAGDNLSIKLDDGCGTAGDTSLLFELYSLNGTALAPGMVNVTRSTSGYAAVTYSDKDGSQQAVSGSVQLDVVDFQTLRNTRGAFSVRFNAADGGTSLLAGTFDARYLCQ